MEQKAENDQKKLTVSQKLSHHKDLATFEEK